MKQFVRMAASLTATVLGGVLLIADGDMCSRYAALHSKARYVATDCGELASEQGAVSLDLPATDSDADAALDETARQQFEAGGVHASAVLLHYDEECTGNKDRAVAEWLQLTLHGTSGDYRCTQLDLPVLSQSTVSCRSTSAPDDPVCTIQFRPAPP